MEDLNGLRPAIVVEQVSARLDRPFSMHMHTQAWHYYNVRPPTGAADPAATKSDFCRYNSTFEQYVYTPAWVNYLVRHLNDEPTYAAVLAWPKGASVDASVRSVARALPSDTR